METSAITIVTDLIANQGFPIALVLIAVYFMYKIVSRDKDEARERELKLMANLEQNTAALSENATAYVKISDALDSYVTTVTTMNSKLDNIVTELRVNNTKTDTILANIDKIKKD